MQTVEEIRMKKYCTHAEKKELALSELVKKLRAAGIDEMEIRPFYDNGRLPIKLMHMMDEYLLEYGTDKQKRMCYWRSVEGLRPYIKRLKRARV
jgi:hypothetical protein